MQSEASGRGTHQGRGFEKGKSFPTNVTLGETSASFKRHGQSCVAVAEILGRKLDGHQEWVWLDRLIHEPDENFAGWQASGAISTVLYRDLRAVEPDS